MTPPFQTAGPAACLAILTLASVPAAAPCAQETAIVDVALVPLDRDTLLEHRTVIVRGDRSSPWGRPRESKRRRARGWSTTWRNLRAAIRP